MTIPLPASLSRLFKEYQQPIVMAAAALLLVSIGGVAALLTNDHGKQVAATARAKTSSDSALGKGSDRANDSDVLGSSYQSEPDDNAQTPSSDNATTPPPPPLPAATPPAASQPSDIYGNFAVNLKPGETGTATFGTSDGNPVDWSSAAVTADASKISADLLVTPAAHQYAINFTALTGAAVGDTFTYTVTAGALAPKTITVTIVDPTTTP